MRAIAILLAGTLLFSLCWGSGSILLAQRGPGGGKGGGKGGGPGGGGPGGGGPGGGGPGQGGGNPWGRGAPKAILPQLEVEDVKPEGAYSMAEMFAPNSGSPRIGVTDEYCYRLAGYQPDGHALRFAFYDFKTQQLRTVLARLPKECPAFDETPRMAYDAAGSCVISRQALTLFIEPKTGKVKMAAGYDKALPIKPPARGPMWGRGPAEERDRPPYEAMQYRVHGGGGGKHALSVFIKYDAAQKAFTGNDATLHSADGRSVTLKWNHAQFGVPPKDRDAVFAVNGNEAVVLVVKPRDAGDFHGVYDLACLVFDAQKGDLKEAQVSPAMWAGSTAKRFTLSPDGNFLVAQQTDTINGMLVRRGSWDALCKTAYHDACVGFAPEGNIGVFLASHTPTRAGLVALDLATAKEVWRTTVAHEEGQGEGNDEPFYSVGPGARTVAMRTGIIKGATAENAEVIYGAKAVEFVPLAMSYDSAGKRVAVLTLERLLVLDAKNREELLNVPFEKSLPKGCLGEFVAFNEKGDKIMAVVRDQGAWIFDVATATITVKAAAPKGTWMRPLPDLSGVVYSMPKADGGNVMCQAIAGGDPKQIFRTEYKDTQAVCLWINEKGNEFLVAEKEMPEGSLRLIDDKGRVVVQYNVKDVDTMYTGDSCVTAFVTRKREAVLINEVTRWDYTGVNCTVISAEPGDSISRNFSAVFETANLAGMSTYGKSAAAPFFAAPFWGDDSNAAFACPAGVLSVSIAKNSIKLYAWSRKPRGLTAVSPKTKEFFVAGNEGLTSYKFK